MNISNIIFSVSYQLHKNIQFHFSEWLWADYQLYNHFKRKFLKIAKNYGIDRIDYENEILKKETHSEKIHCQSKTPQKSCKYYWMPEGQLLNVAGKRQAEERVHKLISLRYFDKFKHQSNENK